MPQASVAVQVRVMTDSFAHAPAATLSLDVTVGAPSQLSVAVAEPVPAGLLSASHSIVRFAGSVSTGAVVSSMVNVALVSDGKLHASVAVKVTFAEPVSAHPSDKAVKSLLNVTAPHTSVAEAPPSEFN